MKVGDEVCLKFDEGVRGRVISHNVVLSNGDYDAYQDADLILASECVAPAMNQGHPNATILMEIAKEAAVNPEYWKEFGYDSADFGFMDFYNSYSLFCRIDAGLPIIRKPRTIRIGKYDVPEPSGAWINPFIKGDGVVVDLKFKTNDEAELMLKALQELLGAKK